MQVGPVVLKEGRVTISGADGPPMVVQPLLPIVDPHFTNQWLAMLIGYWYDECLDSVRPFYITPIPKRLFFIVFIFLHNDFIRRNLGCKVCNAGQIVRFNEDAAHM